jgi:hypothetical protein
MELGFTLTLTMNVICDILVQGKSVTLGGRFVDVRVQNAILLSLLAATTQLLCSQAACSRDGE